MNKRKIKVKGEVVEGIGKGAFFLSLEPYKSFFKGLLGKEPYPGTLNVKLDKNWDEYITLPNTFNPAGYGGISYALGSINGIKVVVIRPHKSKHPKNIIEIVSDKFLRGALNIVNGKKIEFEIFV